MREHVLLMKFSTVENQRILISLIIRLVGPYASYLYRL